ncbi:MAG: thiamine-phosphate kinase [Pyrinomonadaceae bacterium]
MKDQGSEFDFINRIRRRALKQHHTAKDSDSSLCLGIGDDAAVVRQFSGRESVITADLLVEDVDFRRDTIPARLLGHKALAVSLSDIAAMGARPRWALLSVGVPRDIWRSRFLEEFYEGFFALASEHGVTLIGGDVSRTPDRIVIDSIVLGEAARGRAVLRSGAQAGDHIFVTGTLGGSAAGLRLIEGGARLLKRASRRREAQATERLLLRHLRPQPRVEWGAALGRARLATAMIDISDGLSSDLAHLCRESKVGALLEASRIPVDPLIAQVRASDIDPLSLALHGGEDFELLFTVRPRSLARLPQEIDGARITYIGDVTNETGRIRLASEGRARILKPEGFTHFGRRS